MTEKKMNPRNQPKGDGPLDITPETMLDEKEAKRIICDVSLYEFKDGNGQPVSCERINYDNFASTTRLYLPKKDKFTVLEMACSLYSQDIALVLAGALRFYGYRIDLQRCDICEKNHPGVWKVCALRSGRKR